MAPNLSADASIMVNFPGRRTTGDFHSDEGMRPSLDRFYPQIAPFHTKSLPEEYGATRRSGLQVGIFTGRKFTFAATGGPVDGLLGQQRLSCPHPGNRAADRFGIEVLLPQTLFHSRGDLSHLRLLVEQIVAD